MSTPAVNQPDSAPVEAIEISPQERLDHASSADLLNWRKTGDLPPVKPPAESAPAAKVETPKSETKEVAPEPDASAAPQADASASPAPAQKKHRDKTKEDTARRFQEILAERDTFKREKEEYERRLAELTAAPRATPDSQPATDKAAAANPEPKIDDVENGKPKYGSYEEFLAAVRKWDREQWLAEVDSRLSKREQERQQAEQIRITQEQQRVLSEGLNQKFDAVRGKYEDFDEVALNKDLVIPMGSVTDVFLLESEIAGDVAYYLGQHPEILDSFYGDYDLKTGKFTNKINPMKQHRKLLEIERELSSEPKPVIPSVKKEPVKLPPPPREVDGRNAAPVDEAEAALARGDTAGYIRVMNQRDLKAARR